METSQTTPKNPRLELHYTLRDDNTQFEPAFREAVAAYAKVRPPEEEISYSADEYERSFYISIGRSILLATSYAYIEHQADLTQEAIEERVREVHHEYDWHGSRAGKLLYGSLPDPE